MVAGLSFPLPFVELLPLPFSLPLADCVPSVAPSIGVLPLIAPLPGRPLPDTPKFDVPEVPEGTFDEVIVGRVEPTRVGSELPNEPGVPPIVAPEAFNILIILL